MYKPLNGLLNTYEDTINVLVAMANSYEIDKDLVEILKNNFNELDIVREKAHQDTQAEYEKFTNEFEKSKKRRLKLELSIKN